MSEVPAFVVVCRVVRAVVVVVVVVVVWLVGLPSAWVGGEKSLVVGVFEDDVFGTSYPIDVALRQIQNDSSLLPGVNITLIHHSTNSYAGQPLALARDIWQTVDMINGGACMIIGPRQSADSIQVAYTAQVDNYPVLSYGASSADLSNKNNFPTYSRLWLDVGREAQQLAALVASQGWTQIGIVYSSDSTGVALNAMFQAEATRLGMKVLCQVLISGNEANFDFVVSIIKSANARILLDFNDYTAVEAALRITFINAGLTGPGYQWIGSHYLVNVLPVWVLPDGRPNPDQYALLNGIIFVQPATPSNDVWRQLLNTINAYPSNSPPPGCGAPNNTCTKSLAVPAIIAAAYDSMYVFARAAHHLIFDLGMDPHSPSSRSQFLSTIRSTTFIGASGLIAMDSNGDFLTSLNISQWQDLNAPGGATPNLGYFVLEYSSVTNRSEWVVQLNTTTPFNWAGGVKPIDNPPRFIYQVSSSIPNSVSVSSAIVLGGLCMLCLYLTYHRNAPSVKSTGGIFNTIVVVGCLIMVISVVCRSSAYNASLHADPATITTINGVTTITYAGPNSWLSFANHLCLTGEWLVNIGYIIVLGTLLLKTWRVSRVFNMTVLKSSGVGDGGLFFLLCLLVSMECMLLAVLSTKDVQEFVRQNYSGAVNTDIWTCTSERYWATWFPIVYTTRFALICGACVYTYRCRDIPAAFNESRQLLFCVYNLAALSVFLLVVEALLAPATSAGLIVYTIAILIIASTTALILTIPKIILLEHSQLQFFTTYNDDYRTENHNNTERRRYASHRAASEVDGGGGGVLSGGRMIPGTATSGGGAFEAISHGASMNTVNINADRNMKRSSAIVALPGAIMAVTDSHLHLHATRRHFRIQHADNDDDNNTNNTPCSKGLVMSGDGASPLSGSSSSNNCTMVGAIDQSSTGMLVLPHHPS